MTGASKVNVPVKVSLVCCAGSANAAPAVPTLTSVAAARLTTYRFTIGIPFPDLLMAIEEYSA